MVTNLQEVEVVPDNLILNGRRFQPVSHRHGIDWTCLECQEVIRFGNSATVNAITRDLKKHACKKAAEVQ